MRNWSRCFRGRGRIVDFIRSIIEIRIWIRLKMRVKMVIKDKLKKIIKMKIEYKVRMKIKKIYDMFINIYILFCYI
jgi:hypothetical protein